MKVLFYCQHVLGIALWTSGDWAAVFHFVRPLGAAGYGVLQVVRAIEEARPIDLYNHGEMHRDFTYVGDAVEGIIRVLAAPPARSLREENPDESVSNARFSVYNIGNSQTVSLARFVDVIEEALSKKAVRSEIIFRCNWAFESA